MGIPVADSDRLAGRLASLPRQVVDGTGYPVAATFRSRLLGLSRLDREEAGTGLLIPGCRSIHTFGMRFEIDVIFFDGAGRLIRRCVQVPPRRFLFAFGAASVLEIVPVISRGESVRRPEP